MEHLVIMAGGIGSRFWPMSTPERPKQFIDVLGTGKTLLQMTVERFEGIFPPERVWVVTSQHYRSLVREQLPLIPDDHILLEPCRRNTAPCIAYAVWKIKRRDPDARMVISPADHVVADVETFRRVIREGLAFVSPQGGLLTLGMEPSRPETGYGYIEADLSMACPSNKEIYRVDAFKEKPDLETAERYLRRTRVERADQLFAELF